MLDTTPIHILGRHTSLALANEVEETQCGYSAFNGDNVLFNSDRLDLDETCGISWLKAAEFIHGRLLRVI
jgi:hypothetical protein